MSPSQRDLVRERKLAETRKPWLTIGLLALGLVVIAAIMADTMSFTKKRGKPADNVHQRLQDIVLKLNHPPFVDK